ncbi:MAG TPA: tetratricopeptide repeat protein, partial [Amycolatopsis sp.]|nr:tetratricopeptide repeat protein [Amycolatopsis sp.]
TALLERGRLKEAIRRYEKGLALFTEAGNEPYRGQAYLRLGDVYRKMDRPDLASQYYVESLGVFGRMESDQRAGPLIRLASLLAERGELETAESYAQDSLALYRRARDEHKAREVLLELAVIESKRGEHEKAVSAAREAIQLAEVHGDLAGKAVGLDRLAQVRAQAGEPDAARACWEDARGLFEELRDTRASVVADSLTGLAAARAMPQQHPRSPVFRQ